jgi:hypothetical protein
MDNGKLAWKICLALAKQLRDIRIIDPAYAWKT